MPRCRAKRVAADVGHGDRAARPDASDPRCVERMPAQRRRDRAAEMWAALGPVEAAAKHRAPRRSLPIGTQAEGREPLFAVGRNGEPAIPAHEPALGHRVRDRNTEPTGEVVVARAGTGEGLAAGRAGQRRHGRPLPAGGRGDRLDQVGDVRRGYAYVAVPPLPFLGQQTAGDEAAGVLARGGRGHSGVAGQFGDRPRTSVEQCEAERRPRVIREEPGEIRHRLGAAHRVAVSIRAAGSIMFAHRSIMVVVRFGAHRNVRGPDRSARGAVVQRRNGDAPRSRPDLA